jgi:molecular chaperone GrpE
MSMKKNKSKEEKINDLETKMEMNENAEGFENEEELENEKNEGLDSEFTAEDVLSLEGLAEGLKEDNKKLQVELEVLKERLLRTSSEYENFRKRTIKEKEGIYADACEEVLKNMFPVLDNLERAMTAPGDVEDIKKGIDMTIRQFKSSLEKLGVEEIPTSEGFDPNFHNAVMHIEDDAFGKNEVVEVFEKGYKKVDKVLRYTMVKVAN